ncbi:MAG: Gfo/Idh/MocA family oxidoreductase [Dehalococcoidia bacterium]|jgi:predicted dehydrogenase|nr:Gfo/Idh/MocA family oxidoreductase [Dehalococcoidia bacterium]
MTAERVKVGFIGGGAISELHSRGYPDNPTGELYAVADLEPGLARERANQWGAQKAYTDYRELLADPQIDAVEILLPHHLHLPVTLEALAAGKHVSLQKPMAISMDEGRQIAAAAASSDRVFRVFENYRTYEPYMRARSMIEAGEIGNPVSIRIKSIFGKGKGGRPMSDREMEWREDPARGGPAWMILDYGFHITSIITYFMGPVETVHAMADTSAGTDRFPGAPAVISWKHRDSERYGNWDMLTLPEFMVRTSYYPVDEWLEVTGTRGVIWVTHCTADLLGQPPVVMYRDGEMRSYSDMETDWGDSFRLGAHAFTGAIVDGTQPELDGEEAVHALAFAVGAIKSAVEGREVKLREL